MYVKIVELIGESHSGWRDAVQNAVNEASDRYENVTGVEVYNMTADVMDGKLVDFKANVKVAYADK